MKAFFCFVLCIAAASAGIIGPLGGPITTSISGIGAPIGLGGISPLGLGLAQQQLLVNQPLVSNIGLAGPQLISPQLGLGLGATKVIGGGLLNPGLGLGLGGLPLNLGLGGQLISPLNGGLIIRK